MWNYTLAAAETLARNKHEGVKLVLKVGKHGTCRWERREWSQRSNIYDTRIFVTSFLTIGCDGNLIYLLVHRFSTTCYIFSEMFAYSSNFTLVPWGPWNIITNSYIDWNLYWFNACRPLILYLWLLLILYYLYCSWKRCTVSNTEDILRCQLFSTSELR